MATKVQVAVDCQDSRLLMEFSATALHYVIPDPPAPFERWSEYRDARPEDNELISTDQTSPELAASDTQAREAIQAS